MLGKGVHTMNAAAQAELLRLARRTIREAITSGQVSGCPMKDGWLQTPAAVFVTLRGAPSYYEPEGELRGCVGQVEASGPLCVAVQDAAVKAATVDPRFDPVTLEEVDDLSIEISVLSPMRPVERYEEIEIGRDGLFIIGERRRGLLLPEVPLRYGWEPREFVRQLCRKAGLPDDAWPDHARLLAFTTESFTAAGGAPSDN
jgi:AmmeMemoRadiSam system protein A